MKTRLRSSGKLAGGLGLLLALALAMLLVVPATALPQQPHQVYGSVTQCGAPVTEGTVVEVWIDGVLYPNSTTTVDADGNYGYDPLFKLPADDTDPGKTGGVNGDPVEFYVLGQLAGTSIFQIGGTTELNLEVPCADTTPPIVVNTSPVDGATGVAINTLVTATFNEPVLDAGAIDFTLDGVPGTVTYNDATFTATFDPTANLAYSTTYTASIQASDLAGNPMAAPYTWSFTTQPSGGPTIALVEGVNIIAYTGATTALPDALTNIGPGGMDLVDGLFARADWTGGAWMSYNARLQAGDLTQLETGRAYIIVVTQDCIWELPQ